jgi:NAD(P)-dependent dehydrogenase (short-subunit alcohol dehydrogenase family)
MASKSLVIGGTGGIGYAIACRIAANTPSSTVIISGRNEPKNIPHSNIQFRALDASSMRAIKNYTDELKASQDRFGTLVLTQGILTTAGRTETSEGIDRKMALHYYGRQLLIRELMPALTEDAKVLIVLDSVRGGPDKLNWDDLDLKSTFSIANAAAHCLSMNDAMIQYYGSEQKSAGTKRHFIHATPGVVRTNIGSSLPWYLRGPASALSVVLGVSPETCAENMVKGIENAAASGEKEGRYWEFINEKGVVFEKPAWNEEQVQKVKEHTWGIVDDALKD